MTSRNISVLNGTSIGIQYPSNGAQFNKCGLHGCAKYALIKLPQNKHGIQYIKYLRKCAFPNDHGSPAFVSPTGRCPLTTGGSTPTEGKASVVSEHLFVGETKTANRVLQEIRTHFSRPVIGWREQAMLQLSQNWYMFSTCFSFSWRSVFTFLCDWAIREASPPPPPPPSEEDCLPAR